MPVWHERTKAAVANGSLAIVGVIQEQHADRCRLFAQWKGFQWPILQDAINLLGPRVVPIVVAIDEAGIVQSVNPKDEDFDAFMSRKPISKTEVATDSESKHTFNRHQLYEQTILAAGKSTKPQENKSPVELGDGLMLWGTDADLDDAISNYQQSIEDDSSGVNHFRLGVAFRRRYESVNRRPGDFGQAVKHWQHALDRNPNQYIWRRRIQQYGPRMEKPYAFYDWMSQAQADIAARGEGPIATRGELTRAELAQPVRQTDFIADQSSEPDAKNRIAHDESEFVRVQATVVPPAAEPGKTVRVFLEFSPNAKKSVHWTNDAGPAQLWIENSLLGTPKVERSLWEISSAGAEAQKPTDHENRIVEFEVQIPDEPSNPKANTAPSIQVNGYALYYICEGESGTCLYRRRDVSISIPIAKAP